MPGFKVNDGSGSYATPAAVKVLSGGQWQDASAVKANDAGQWVDVYSAEPVAPSTSYVFVSESQLQKQKQRVDDGKWPFGKAYNRFMNRADKALNASLRSVTDDSGDDYGPHRFEARTNNRADYRAAVKMSEVARDCGLAYWFTGQDKYAEKVVDVVHHWFLKDRTYMIPKSSIPKANGTIRQFIWIPSFLYGASFVRNHYRWGRYDGSRPWDGGDSGDAESAFKHWVRDWQSTLRDSEPDWCIKNNRWPWRIANRAAIAAYLADDDLMTTAKRMYCAEIRNDCAKHRHWASWTRVDGNEGYFSVELLRDDAFDYTSYFLLGCATCCTAFEAWDGTDLWSFTGTNDDDGGATLRKACNWSELKKATTNRWSWSRDADGVNISDGDIEQTASLYELAHARWNEFDNQINNSDVGGRPHWDRRLLGPITLTHGEP